MRKPRPDALKADAATLRGAAAVHADPIVANRDAQHAVLFGRRDRDRAAGLERRDAVPDRVFDERLQQQVGHERTTRLGRRLDGETEAILKANAFEVQILLRERQLLVQADFLRRLGRKRSPQQIAQLSDHPFREAWIVAHERRDGVQGIEQKVRSQAGFDVRELRAREIHLEARRAQVTLAHGVVVHDRLVTHEDGAVAEAVAREPE